MIEVRRTATGEDAGWPILLYIYNADGTYDEPVEILSDSQLTGPGMALVIRHAVATGRKVIMTDPLDRCVFHAENGRLIFPPQQAAGAKVN